MKYDAKSASVESGVAESGMNIIMMITVTIIIIIIPIDITVGIEILGTKNFHALVESTSLSLMDVYEGIHPRRRHLQSRENFDNVTAYEDHLGGKILLAWAGDDAASKLIEKIESIEKFDAILASRYRLYVFFIIYSMFLNLFK